MSLFITFEGTEGCGKTTQIKRLAAHLTSLGYQVLVTREPGGCPIADAIRALLLDPASSAMDPTAELLLYAAARAQHLHEVVRPALAQGQIVLCDRFSDATRAYQGYGRQLPQEQIEQTIRLATGGLEPDITLWFDLPVELGLERSIERLSAEEAPAEDRFERETLAFHQRIREGYQDLLHQFSQRIIRVDASGTMEEVEQRVQQQILPRVTAAL